MGAWPETDRLAVRVLASGTLLLQALAAHAVPPPPRTSVVLLTLDTTRADALGCYGAGRPTPALDGLAARGMRYTTALTASPLTLPAHSSLLTGLDPPEHGVTDNGTSVLESDVPTLATELGARGYDTAAFVASRILDRRFGLSRGFAVYDDRMAAERTGEYGYPERDAATVTSAALGWLKARPPVKPFFLWVHYYDAHAPYDAPGPTPAAKYLGEVAVVDREIGRLLAALPTGAGAPVIAAVGDHGESLGEHGERGHGLFLYDAALHVPLILAGPGVPAGRSVDELVATRRLAATLLRLAGTAASLRGPALPGLRAAEAAPQPVFSETMMPASAYGWAPLRSLAEGRWRFIEAPRSELYDLAADPGQTADKSAMAPADLARLRRGLQSYVEKLKVRGQARAPAPEAAEAARSLGYLSGASGGRAGTIDPKDGIGLLAEMEQARTAARPADVVARLQDLCKRSPGNVPFLTSLARAQTAAGDLPGAIATLDTALDANPRSEFLHVHRGELLRRLGRTAEARKSYEAALQLNPRAAAAWLSLAEMAGGDEYDVLRRADAAGTASATLLTRLAALEVDRGQDKAADGHLAEATTLLPGLSSAWLLWAALAEKDGRDADAIARFERAATTDPKDPTAFLHMGRLQLRRGDSAGARRNLQTAMALAPSSPAGREAARLLQTFQP